MVIVNPPAEFNQTFERNRFIVREDNHKTFAFTNIFIATIAAVVVNPPPSPPTNSAYRPIVLLISAANSSTAKRKREKQIKTANQTDPEKYISTH
jgi:hypothetical protein